MIEPSNIKNNAEIIKLLTKSLEENDLVLVTFTTKVGTQRVMGCTRKMSAIPEENRECVDDGKLNYVLYVYDFQNSAWRSFRKDSVTSFEVCS